MDTKICPDCGGALYLDVNAEQDVVWFCPNPGGCAYLETRRQRVALLACSSCEYVCDVTRRVKILSSENA